jgi:hypothetical protein
MAWTGSEALAKGAGTGTLAGEATYRPVNQMRMLDKLPLRIEAL